METSNTTSNVNPSRAATASTQQAAPKNTLDKDSFLKLLVAQLQHQDPTQTQDSDKMIQQMTSFSSLEQMQNQTRVLEALQSQNLGIFQSQSTNLVGKNVRISQGMTLKDGKANFVVNLSDQAVSAKIAIKDANGAVVRVMDKGALPKGDNSIAWDGRDDKGKLLSDGIYTLEAACKDSAGNAVTATTSCFAKVESVSFSQGGVLVKAAGRLFNLSEISEVSGTAS